MLQLPAQNAPARIGQLKLMEVQGNVLAVHQKSRLATLQERAEKHNRRNTTTGASAKQQETIRVRRRKGNQKRHGKRKGKPSATGSGVNRFKRKIPPCPQELIDKMTDGIRIFIGLLGQESVALTMLNKVCDKVLLHEWQAHGIREPDLTKGGLPFAHKQSCRNAMDPLLDVSKTGQSCEVRNFESFSFKNGKAASGQDMETLLQEMMKQLHPAPVAKQRIYSGSPFHHCGTACRLVGCGQVLA